MSFVPEFWHWWILAVVLIIFEMVAPTFFALWLGIAAFVTGAAYYFVPSMSWENQAILFAILAVGSIVVWRRYYRNNPIKTDQPMLNRRGEQYIGRVVTLTSPIIDGVGKIKLDDSTWKVEGPDAPLGTRVRIVALKNIVFTVELAD